MELAQSLRRVVAQLVIAVGVVAAVLLIVRAPTSVAAFFVTSAATGSASSDTLNAPTGLSASRPCTSSPGPAPVLRASASALESGGSATVTRPAGVVAGDLLLAFAHVSDQTAGNNADTPSGWTFVVSRSDIWADLDVAVFSRVAGSSEPASYTFTGFDSIDAGSVVVLAYSGASSASPVQTSSTSSFLSSFSAIAPSVTLTSAPATLVVAVAVASYSIAGTPAGMTARESVTTSFPSNLLATFDEARSGTGATGTRTSAIGWLTSGVTISLAISAGTVVDPTVTFTWTPTVDTYATGYRLTRTGGGTVATDIAGRTTSGTTDATTSSTVAYAYSLVAVRGAWTSTAATANVAAC